jgi:hypothetical protein
MDTTRRLQKPLVINVTPDCNGVYVADML